MTNNEFEERRRFKPRNEEERGRLQRFMDGVRKSIQDGTFGRPPNMDGETTTGRSTSDQSTPD